MRLLPGWRNGRRGGLKSRCPSGRAGSNPAPGIQESRDGSVARIVSQSNEPRRAIKNPAGLGLALAFKIERRPPQAFLVSSASSSPPSESPLAESSPPQLGASGSAASG